MSPAWRPEHWISEAIQWLDAPHRQGMRAMLRRESDPARLRLAHGVRGHTSRRCGDYLQTIFNDNGLKRRPANMCTATPSSKYAYTGAARTSVFLFVAAGVSSRYQHSCGMLHIPIPLGGARQKHRLCGGPSPNPQARATISNARSKMVRMAGHAPHATSLEWSMVGRIRPESGQIRPGLG